MWGNFNKIQHKITLVAPGNGKRISHLLNESIIKFKQKGYIVESTPVDLFDNNSPFHSNSEEYRYNHLITALNDSECKVIWALAGGYGSAKLIDKLKLLPCPTQEKIFIGFSDVTALHLFFNKNWHWHPIHGAAFIQIIEKESNIDMILNLIENKSPPVPLTLNLLSRDKYTGNISGELIGGNLAIVQNSLGTTWEIETKEKIVFLEDVNEYGYKVDRMLLHLEQAGIFENVRAVIFGEFNFNNSDTITEENDLIEYALNEFAGKMNFPVFKTEKFGHGHINTPIVEGALGIIEYDKDSYKFSYELS